MPRCSRCHGWISALVYECAACGEKPKGPPPRGIIASDVDEARHHDVQAELSEPEPGEYAQAPGPSTQSPPPIAERPVRPAVAPRPAAPRPATPPKSTPSQPPSRPAAARAGPGIEDGAEDIVEVVKKKPLEDLPDMDTPVG